LPQALYEKTEGLEQLRVLYEGKTILVETVRETPIGIDTPEDYARFVKMFADR
jgi:3-deoxy-manno-octulosonate cytidylyltransferase (CMP-KDO synthetase)